MRLTRFAPVLTLALLPALPVPPALAQQASVSATDGTNALGSIPCAAQPSAPLSECPAEYLDKGDGKATLRVLLPGGMPRTLYIEGGKIASSDNPSKLRSSKANGTYFVFIGETERFEIPATAVE